MSETSHGTGRGPSQRHVEVGVAVATFLFGVIVIIGALEVGITWGIEGPRAGFFPFYLGLFIIVSSVINLVRVFPEVRREKIFAQWSELRSVTSVFIPIAVYVGLVPWVGIYAASVVLIALFMRWLGRFGWLLTLTVAIGVPVLTFIVFERWFLIPLPKGPIEDALNL